MATRKDVAARAGVSEATVSYTLSGKRTISAATQERVRRAMTELGYQPHMMAQALAGKSSPVIAVLFPVAERGISNADMEYVLGAAAAARKAGRHALLWPTTGDDVDDVIAVHRSGLVGGVVLMEVLLEDRRVQDLSAANVPCALIGRTHDDGLAPFVDRDFDSATRLAVGHLADLGHEEIWFLSGPERLVQRGFGAPVRAGRGFHQACSDRGVRGSVRYAEALPEEGSRVAAAVTGAADRPTALVTLNVEATLGLLQSAPHAGLTIPEDLSVVSIGVPEAWAAASEPSLTSISTPADEMGAAAVHQLIARIDGAHEAGRQALFTGELVVRDSTAPPPTRPS